MRGSLLILALGGCNWLYGLDETRPLGPDPDGDGIAEGDNCPAIANVDQDDTDRDQVGDICDPCIDGAQLYVDADGDGVDDGCDVCARGAGDHDEDRDGIADACDNCPAIANDQANVDADDLGDACDGDPTTKQTRVAFAGFDTVPTGWIANLDEWTITNDTVGPAMQPTIGEDIYDGLWNRSISAVSPRWALDVSIQLPANAPVDYVVGIAMRPRNGSAGPNCRLQRMTTGWEFSASYYNIAPVPVSVGTTVHLRIEERAPGSARCRLDDVPYFDLGVGAGPVTPLLYTFKNRAAFAYADVLD